MEEGNVGSNNLPVQVRDTTIAPPLSSEKASVKSKGWFSGLPVPDRTDSQ